MNCTVCVHFEISQNFILGSRTAGIPTLLRGLLSVASHVKTLNPKDSVSFGEKQQSDDGCVYIDAALE